MSSKISKVVIDIDGIREIRKSSEVQSIVDGQVQAIAGRAGDGFAGDTMVGKTRIQGVVKTTSKEAYFRALHNHTLSKCLK